MNKNTTKTYQRAFEIFTLLNGITLERLVKYEAKELSRLIDETFDATEYDARTKRTYIHGVRTLVESMTDMELSRSKLCKILNKEIPRHSDKEKLPKTEIRKLRDYFHSGYVNADLHLKEKHLRNFILFNLLAFTGQRIGDILKLGVREAKKMTINFKQEKTGQEVSIENPCLSEIAFYANLAGLKEKDFLFASGLKRHPLDYTQAYRIIRDAGLLVLGKEISPHHFRTYVITELRLAGKTNAEIQSVSGHANSNMIDYYSVEQPKIDNVRELLI